MNSSYSGPVQIRTFNSLRPVLGGKYENYHKSRVITKSNMHGSGVVNEDSYIQISKRDKNASNMPMTMENEDSVGKNAGRKIEASIMSPAQLNDQANHNIGVQG